ncbi:MAG: alanine--tRNA ligase [Candidatus Lokiarchaeota archaeon]|nr:alanine--tRNA ligase [Candidatus Lokiarchaeota archaeon]
MLSENEIDLLKDCQTDKELKTVFKTIASKNPDAYFPTTELKDLGYMRKQCSSCGTYFWTTHEDRRVCGDPSCSGGFDVVLDNPAPQKLSYIEVWKKIVEVLEPRGYVPIKRYPCVARWNPTSEFTIASISAFQPYVITGEEEPPAKKLLIPQFCLRFNDIENVGITGSHNTGFVMIGQHSFVSPEEWNQGELFMDMHDFISIGVGLSKNEITIHEDSWAGGGSFGCSLEFFSRGVELFNQVYTMFEQTPKGPRELKLKVLDMGLGQERVAWFSQGTPNMYEATFPYVLSKLREKTKIELDHNLYNRFSKFSAYLNADEVEDMDAAWQRVAEELNISVEKLRNTILPMTGLYSIAEHARSLLFAIHDGKLPSNVGGGYNLRVIFRRAIGFIDKFGWNIEIADVCRWHAEELKDLFPEVSENLDEIKEILDVEKEKYYATKKKASKILEKELNKGKIDTETLIEMYDSNGISPDMVKEAAKKYNVQVKIPDNFYNLVVQRHEQSEQVHATKKEIELELDDIPETESLYYYDYTKTENKAKVLKITDHKVILDKSVAYPTAGGQLHDIGTINGQIFKDVFKQGNHVIHVLDEDPEFSEGDEVTVKVDEEWRRQLSQHHTATHIVNAAAREILGSHVNQAGAKKTLESSHLDITHYEQLTNEQLSKIEERANEIVNEAIDLNLKFMPRADAEHEYGMEIYQGGAVPGSKIRIVEVPGVDVEACGGTHLNNTAETGQINIIKSQKIQDGVVRLIYTAGKASKRLEKRNQNIISELESFLDVEEGKIVGRVKELFDKWKNINKALSTGNVNEEDLHLNSSEIFQGDILTELSEVLNLPKDKILPKVKQFYNEWEEGKDKLDKMQKLLSNDFIKKLLSDAETYKGFKVVVEDFENLSQEDLKNLNQSILRENDTAITILLNKNQNGYIVMGMLGPKASEDLDLHLGNFIRKIISHFDGKGGGSSEFFQGFIGNKDLDLEEIKSHLREELHKI